MIYNHRNQQNDSQRLLNLETSIINNRNSYEGSNNLFNIFLVGFCTYLIYFTLVIIPVFIDLIFGFVNVYYYNKYECIFYENAKTPFIDITSWMLVNGLFGYLGIVMYINLKYIHTEYGFCNKLVRVFCYFISLFSLLWNIFGMISFFRNYYKVDKCISSYPLLYNYTLIRMILGPIIWLTNFFIIFNER